MLCAIEFIDIHCMLHNEKHFNGSDHDNANKNTVRDLQNQIFTFANEKIGFSFFRKRIQIN